MASVVNVYECVYVIQLRGSGSLVSLSIPLVLSNIHIFYDRSSTLDAPSKNGQREEAIAHTLVLVVAGRYVLLLMLPLKYTN